MLEEMQEVWRFRYLLRQFVSRELKIRYKNSVFGVLWSVVPLIISVLVYSFLFSKVMGKPIPNYSAYALCGIIPWTFFTTACLDSCQSLLNNYSIMKKVYLPREIIPLAYVISNGIHFLIGWAFYFTTYYLVWPHVLHIPIPVLHTIVWFPVVLVMECLLVLGLSFWFAALNLYYQDVKYVLQTLFSLLLFLLPILYPAYIHLEGLRNRHMEWAYSLYLSNPIAAMLTGFRETLLEPVPVEQWNATLHSLPREDLFAPTWTYVVASLLTFLILWSGYTFFNYRKWQFVERH
ncbi:MAG: ABC-type polysaccharide/polyol phosphate export system, permease component [Chthonomonadales bacterium]|nr:ABC-type polysaccharide/polyol phosphate export system, permease component [Chthonomonadales bacterium]